MSDLGLTWNPTRLSADLTVSSGDLALDEGLRTAVLLSLFTDRQAEPGDVLPDGSADRRGWWADELLSQPGDKFGSRLWLLDRSKRTPDVLERAKEYAREALRWLVEDRIATAVDVVPEFVDRGPGWALTVSITRQNGQPVSFRVASVWFAEEQRA